VWYDRLLELVLVIVVKHKLGRKILFLGHQNSHLQRLNDENFRGKTTYVYVAIITNT
jgi:hypothetical protein